tara:strand:+ start:831 stop:1784 length:954 start_codon:yes stop_codon:yes gene_type:complete
MENANVQDTPNNANEQDTTNAFSAPNENIAQDSSGELSVDDIILGGVDDTAPAFGIPEEPSAPSQPVDAKNDNTRFEYWQSKAAKLENEMNQVKNAQMQQQQLAMQQQQMMQQQQAQAQPAQEQFPDAPEKPKKPRNFSREEAYADGSSESARYLDEVEEWRDDMEEYKELRHQYDIALVQEQLRKEQEIRVAEAQRQQAYAQQMQQVQQVSQTVQQKYGLNESEAQSFIKDMSSADSLTMDNLVQLWRMQNGQAAPVQNAPVQNAPSPTFQQTKRAQQIPSPMGTMPSTGTQAQGSTEDQIMDKMVSDFNAKNPFK